jgi:hypothetical protein
MNGVQLNRDDTERESDKALSLILTGVTTTPSTTGGFQGKIMP